MVNPDIWGPHAWKFLHAEAQGFPDEPTDTDREHYNTLFMTLRYTLPCPKCREHLSKYIESNPPNVNNREDLEKWVIDMHNAVNMRLGQHELSYTEAARIMNTVSPTLFSNLLNLIYILFIAFLSQYLF